MVIHFKKSMLHLVVILKEIVKLYSKRNEQTENAK